MQSYIPKAGDRCRLSITRGHYESHHTVLVLARQGEWCTILDLTAYGQPNPYAAEPIRWTNPHIKLQVLPHLRPVTVPVPVGHGSRRGTAIVTPHVLPCTHDVGIQVMAA